MNFKLRLVRIYLFVFFIMLLRTQVSTRSISSSTAGGQL